MAHQAMDLSKPTAIQQPELLTFHSGLTPPDEAERQPSGHTHGGAG